MIEWFVQTLRDNPAIAIFLVLGVGFWIGKLKYKAFSLGTVTSVLLVGVLVGQLDIPVSGPLKSVSFLLFLFAIGYSVGPQFFRSLKGSGVKQVVFAVVMCVICLAVTWITALAFHYNVGEALGLFAGAQTISAVIGVGQDAIGSMSASASDKAQWMDIIPVCYAVTYIFGTIGSAWILSSVGPWMLGGLKKVKLQTAELEAQMNESVLTADPAFIDANRPVVYRAYRCQGGFFASPRKVREIVGEFKRLGCRIFVERLRIGGVITDGFTSDTVVSKGDEIVLSGRREFMVEREDWIGPEVSDEKLLTFSVERVPVVFASKALDGSKVTDIRELPEMAGVVIASITDINGVRQPVVPDTAVHRGDTLILVGPETDVKAAADKLGYLDRPTTSTDMVFVGLGVFIGALIGAITLKLGGIPVSLSTSGGALIAGLVMGWWRSKRPTFGNIPSSSLWILNNLGLNMFIAVIGISSGPTFVQGIMQVGWMLFVAGMIATSIPLLIGIWLGDKVFKFHPAINLGCVAGSRVTTAALGAIQDTLGSTVPAMGYTITYAVGNTLLILMALVMALFM